MRPISAPDRTAARAALAFITGAALLSWTTGMASAGSYLARCPAAGNGSDRLTVTSTAPTEPGCASRPLPIGPDAVLAVLAAPRRAADAPDAQTVTITGTAAKGSFEARTRGDGDAGLARPARALSRARRGFSGGLERGSAGPAWPRQARHQR
jgi:hypothetical protein